VGAGGPSLGDLRAGLVASATSGAVSAVSGGLACVIGAVVIGAAIPSLRSWRADAATHGGNASSSVDNSGPSSSVDT
jgi:hypothetical protein